MILFLTEKFSIFCLENYFQWRFAGVVASLLLEIEPKQSFHWIRNIFLHIYCLFNHQNRIIFDEDCQGTCRGLFDSVPIKPGGRGAWQGAWQDYRPVYSPSQVTIDRSIVPWEAVGISMISHVTLFQPMTDSESWQRYNKYIYIYPSWD